MVIIATVPKSGTVELIDFLWSDATAKEAIEIALQSFQEPCHGAALLSCGTEKLEPSTELQTCRSTSFTLTNYSRLTPAKSAEAHIPTELRGITIQQLSDVVAFIRDFAPLWYEAHRASPQWGQVLAPDVFGLKV